MKKHLLALITLAALTSNAQQTITGTSPISYSVSFGAATAATASTVPVSTTGANVTWNCASLQNSAAFTLSMSAPAGMPYANDYPSANYNLNASVFGNLVVNEFYILNADSLVKLGGHVPGNSYETYQNPQIEMKFPFSFNNTYTDTYAKTSYNSGGGVTSTQTGSVTLTYVGYGTLILPMGTFTNVAMLQRIRTNSIGPTTTSYSWVKFPSGERLLEWDNNGSIKANYAMTMGTVGLNEHNAKGDYLLYPSVNNGTFNIKNLSGDESIFIMNVTGEIMKDIQADNSTELELSMEAKGIYFVMISDKQGSKTLKKLIVQ